VVTHSRISLTWSATRTPRATGTIELPGAVITDWDPRAGISLRILAGYPTLYGLEWVDVRTATQTRAGVELEVATQDARLLDGASVPTMTLAAATTLAALQAAVAQARGAAPFWDVTAVTDAGPAVTLDGVTDLWDVVATMCERMSWRAWASSDGWWTVAPIPVAPSTDPGARVLTLLDGSGGALSTRRRTIRRDGIWCSRVLIEYEWTTGAGAPQRVVGTSGATGWPGRTTVLRRTTPTTLALANIAATNLRDRLSRRGEIYEVETPTAFWVRPDDQVGIAEYVAGSNVLVDRFVDEVTMSTDAPMTITTRE
jgi:hypothetical protein